jgi:hypothetical protein
MFAAFPIVYTESRHWSQGIGGLAFIGVLIGMIAAVSYNIWIENPRYQRIADEHKGFAPPEARLPTAMIGGILLPIGLFWFAWTNAPSLPWAASMAAGIPFGAGMVLVFLSIMNYLIDAYTIFAASTLAANAVLRSIFGAAFPLFTTQMYGNLGVHWASSIPAFLALACVPFPFLFYKYGAAIRARCKFAAEAEEFMKQIRGEVPMNPQESEDEAFDEAEARSTEKEEVDFEAEVEASHDKELEPVPNSHTFERIKTGRSIRTQNSDSDWDDNPFVVDRVHTSESFRSGKGSRQRNRSRT